MTDFEVVAISKYKYMNLQKYGLSFVKQNYESTPSNDNINITHVLRLLSDDCSQLRSSSIQKHISRYTDLSSYKEESISKTR